MAHAKKAAAAATDAQETVWAYGIRTWDQGGESYGGFCWDLTVGARTEAPDWKANAECGQGLHANMWGMEDWSPLGDLDGVKKGVRVLGVVRWDSALAIDLGGKHKAPWMEVVITTETADLASVLALISRHRNTHLLGLAERLAKQEKTKATTGDGSAAATTGYGSAAATTGYGSAASALGRHSVAAAIGLNATAKAAETGAIMLSAYAQNRQTYEWELKAVFAGMVGQTYGDVTIQPDTFYRLREDGVIEAVQ